MQCQFCKTTVDETAKFCPECGKPIPKPEPLIEANKEEILTAYEAAEFLKVSRWKIYDLIRKKQIPFREIGVQKRFVRTQLIEWMQA